MLVLSLSRLPYGCLSIPFHPLPPLHIVLTFLCCPVHYLIPSIVDKWTTPSIIHQPNQQILNAFGLTELELILQLGSDNIGGDGHPSRRHHREVLLMHLWRRVSHAGVSGQGGE